jgi:hypothetical protein
VRRSCWSLENQGFTTPPPYRSETLVDDFAVRSLRYNNLLHVNRLTTGGDGIPRAFIERHIVAVTLNPFHSLTPLKNYFSRSMFAANPFVGWLALSCITMSLSQNSSHR